MVPTSTSCCSRSRRTPADEQYVDALLALQPATSWPPSAPSSTPSLVEPLSSREVTVLRYLCSRLTYREIAAALYVSLNTLKSHVRRTCTASSTWRHAAAMRSAAGRRSV